MSGLDRLAEALLQLTTTTVVQPLTEAQITMLRADLPSDVIRTREQAGQRLSYVDGWYVVQRLNEVLGFGGWTFECDPPVITEVDKKRVVHVRGTLSAGGVRRQDLGAAVTAGSTADALENAIKAAATDALKRCARTFGASLGLALYDKEQRTVGASTKALELKAAVATTTDVNAWVKANDAALRALDKDDRAELWSAIDARRAELSKGATANEGTALVDALKTPLQWIAGASSLDEVIAAGIHASPSATTDALRNLLWDALVARAAALGTDKGPFKERYTAHAKASTPAQWGVVAGALAQLAEAKDAAEVAAVAKRHGAQFKKLPQPLQAIVSSAAAARRQQHADTFDALVRDAGRATSAEGLQAVHQRAERLAQVGQLTEEQIQSLTDTLNERAAIVGVQVAA